MRRWRDEHPFEIAMIPGVSVLLLLVVGIIVLDHVI